MSVLGWVKRVGFMRPMIDLGAFLRDTWRRLGPVKFGALGQASVVALPRTVLGGMRVFIGDRAYICPGAYLCAIEGYGTETYAPEIRIGDDVYVGRDCYMNAIHGIHIGSGCVLSEGVYIADEGHGLDPRAGLIMKQNLTSKGPVRIGANTFIGLRAAILPGVVLGDHCIVGTGAVVTASFPSFSLIAGNPARLLKTYDQGLGNWIPVEKGGK